MSITAAMIIIEFRTMVQTRGGKKILNGDGNED